MSELIGAINEQLGHAGEPPLTAAESAAIAHPAGVDAEGNLMAFKLIMDKTPTEAEIAADLKSRMQEAMKPVLALMDEAASKGLLIQYDGIAPAPPLYRNTVINLRVAKYY